MLAIVVPYYKLIFFEETLRSAPNQTDQRFKVYVGDDASPENFSDVLENYKAKFGSVKPFWRYCFRKFKKYNQHNRLHYFIFTGCSLSYLVFYSLANSCHYNENFL